MEKKFKIGIIGAENSHAVEFTRYFNRPDADGNFAYPDCHVTLVYGHYPESNESLVKNYGADKVAENIEEMIKSVDAVMITARDGKYHAEFARPFIDAGIPAFIDKPFTCDISEAEELIALAKKKGVPLVGGSSLKYAEEVQEVKKAREEYGEEVKSGAVTAPIMMDSEYSGFWFYASHLVEICLEIFGWDPKSVIASNNNKSVCAIIKYDNFSVSCNFTDGCFDSYYASVHGKKTVAKPISLKNIFRFECDAFVEMLRTGKISHDLDKLVKPVKVIDAIMQSYETGKEIEVQ